MGELFVQMCRVNLFFDILDTPEVFWEFDEFYDNYSKCRKYLDLSKRVSIVNKRLEIMKELYEMLHNEVTIQSATYLEKVVAILVGLCVVIDVLAVIVDAYHNPVWHATIMRSLDGWGLLAESPYSVDPDVIRREGIPPMRETLGGILVTTTGPLWSKLRSGLGGGLGLGGFGMIGDGGENYWGMEHL